MKIKQETKSSQSIGRLISITGQNSKEVGKGSIQIQGLEKKISQGKINGWLTPLAKRQVLVHTKNSDNPVYVKIGDLSQALGLSKSLIQKAAKEKGGVEKLIDAHNQLVKEFQNDQVIDKVKAFINQSKNLDFLVAVSQLSPTFKAKDLSRLLDDKRMKNEKMQKTIIKVGGLINQRLANPSSAKQELYVKKSKKGFGFIIDKENNVYIRDNILGKGVYKKALSTFHLQTGDEYAHVAIKGSCASEEVQEEQAALQQLIGCSHIIPPAKITVKTKTRLGETKYVLMQKKLEGDGTRLYKASPQQAMKAIQHVAEGLSEMHRLGWVHSDIKLPNMLVDQDTNGYVHDFGLMTQPGNFKGGTPAFLAPEIKAGESNLTAKADSFALGICMVQLASPQAFLFKLPIEPRLPVKLFGDYSQKEMNNFIKKAERYIKWNPFLPKESKTIKMEMINVAKDLLTINPANRLSCEDAAKRLAVFQNFSSVSIGS